MSSSSCELCGSSSSSSSLGEYEYDIASSSLCALCGSSSSLGEYEYDIASTPPSDTTSDVAALEGRHETCATSTCAAPQKLLGTFFGRRIMRNERGSHGSVPFTLAVPVETCMTSWSTRNEIELLFRE